MQYDPGSPEEIKEETTTQNREEFVLQLFRLFKLVTMHQLNNQAVLRSISAAATSFQAMLRQEQNALTVLFGGADIFVNGQPLKASRGTYESATELGRLLGLLGVNEVSVKQGCDESDVVEALTSFVKAREQPGGGTTIRVHGLMTLVYVDPSFLLGADEEDVGTEDQIVRTYTSALVIMQRAHERWRKGEYALMRVIKRIAQRLVMFSEEHEAALIQATGLRTSNQDAAELALVSAMTAIVSTRLLTRDLAILTSVATSALCHDIGKRRLMSIQLQEEDPFRIPDAPVNLTEDALHHEASASAVGLVDLAGLFDPALRRFITTYESHHFESKAMAATLYQGKITPLIESLIVANSHKLQKMMYADESIMGFSTSLDDVLEKMMSETSSRAELVVIKLICSALGIYPRGHIVRLSSGWTGVILGTPKHPACFSRPLIRLMQTPTGESCVARDVHLSFVNEDVIKLGHIEEIVASPSQEMLDVRRAIKHGTLEISPAAVDAPLLNQRQTKQKKKPSKPNKMGFGIIKKRSAIEHSEATDTSKAVEQPGLAELSDPSPESEVLSMTDLHTNRLRLDKLRFLAELDDDPTVDHDDPLFE